MAMEDMLNIRLPAENLFVNRGTVFTFPTHTHSYYEMTLYDPFPGGITVNGQFCSVDVPSVFLITPSDFHCIRVDGASEARFIKIGFEENILIKFGLNIQDHPIVLKPATDHRLIIDLFHEIWDLHQRGNASVVLVSAAVFYLAQHGTETATAPSGKRHLLTVQALRYANQFFKNDIRLSAVAQQLSVSPQYLSAVFTREVGVGFSSYIRELRLRTAAELLKEHNKNITEICFECGFQNLSHFLRCFKQRYGVSPKAYRRETMK